MLSFTKEELKKFKKLQNIKDNPSDIEKKLIEKTIRYSKFVKLIPWLEMLAIWNSVAMNSANNESDIDLFIVTSKNRLWTVRILITLIFQLLWVRKTSKHHKERFCLSFFCTTNALNFEHIAIENDIYLYYRINSIIPIINYDNTFERFIAENWKWMEVKNSIFKNTSYFVIHTKAEIYNNEKAYYVISSEVDKSIEETSNVLNKNTVIGKEQIPPLQSEWQQKNSCSFIKWRIRSCYKYQSILLDFLEKTLKSIFLPKTKKTFEKLWKPFWVIISNDILKFHNDDKRKEIRDKIFT